MPRPELALADGSRRRPAAPPPLRAPTPRLVVLLLVWSLFVQLADAAPVRVDKPPYCAPKKQSGSTFLWRVKRQPPAYFFGTIHVPYKEVWEHISVEVKKALQVTDTIFLELIMSNPETMRLLNACQMLPNGQHLSQHIPPELYQRLERLMDGLRTASAAWLEQTDASWLNSPAYDNQLLHSLTRNWRRKRPVWVMAMLDSLNLDSFRHHGEPTLDFFLAQEMSEAGKALGAIESAQEHCQPMNALGKRHAVIALNSTLTRVEQLLFATNRSKAEPPPTVTPIRELIENYNCGTFNESIFSRSPASSERPEELEIEEYFRTHILYNRNEKMAERAIRMMESDPGKVIMFAFGVAHFFGRQNVIELVKAAGYDVEPVPDSGLPDAIRPGKGRSTNDRKQPRRNGERRPKGGRRSKGGAASRQLGVGRGQQPSTAAADSFLTSVFGHQAASSGSVTRRQRVFQELWVRQKGFSPRPFTQSSPSPAVKQSGQDGDLRFADVMVETPKSYVFVQYHNHYHATSGAGRVVSALLPVIPFVWLRRLFGHWR